MKVNKGLIIISLISIACFVLSCDKKNMVSNTVNFSQTEYHIGEEYVTIHLSLQEPAATNIPIVLTVQENGILIRDQYTLDPIDIYVLGKIYLTFPKGSKEQKFQVKKLGNNVPQTATVLLNIQTENNSLSLGALSTAALKFDVN